MDAVGEEHFPLDFLGAHVVDGPPPPELAGLVADGADHEERGYASADDDEQAAPLGEQGPEHEHERRAGGRADDDRGEGFGPDFRGFRQPDGVDLLKRLRAGHFGQVVHGVAWMLSHVLALPPATATGRWCRCRAR